MISEQDIRLIENYLFGKLSEQDKTAFEQRLKADKEFADEVDFMRDLEISANELGKKELRSKLKVIADDYKNDGDKSKKGLKTYLAIAASITVFIGIAVLLYILNSKNIDNTNNIAGLNDTTKSTQLNRLIESSAINTQMVTINSVDGDFGYAHDDSTIISKFPVLIIHSEKYANTYLYRDTLFLFLNSEDSLRFYSLAEQSNRMYYSKANEFYSIELKKEKDLTSIKKVDDKDVINKIKAFIEKE